MAKDPILLATIRGYSDMSLKQKTRIKDAVKVREFVPGAVMIQEGKYNNAAFVIIEGEARMEKSIKPNEIP